MQQPTCSNMRIRSTADAHKIFMGVRQGFLHMVSRRLDADERLALRSGCIYAWEERGPHTETTGLGIERFTEGRRWSPSRVRDVRRPLFLTHQGVSPTFYYQRNFCFTTRSIHRHQILIPGISYLYLLIAKR